MNNIDLNNLPQHVAVIMDGNGRWAKSKGVQRIFGHQHGIKAVRETVEACGELGIPYLTLYTFSTENWNRPKIEVDSIMKLLVSTISDQVPDLHKNNVKLQCIGNIETMPEKARTSMLEGIQHTKDNTGLTLKLALNYSGKWDIVQASKKIAQMVKNNQIEIEHIDETLFNANLSTYPEPNVDFLIRTGGDHRISNYLLWQIAYAELMFLDDVFWPDFRKQHFFDAICSFQYRERRFGKTSEQINETSIK